MDRMEGREIEAEAERVVEALRAGGEGKLPMVPLEFYEAAARVGLHLVVKKPKVDGGKAQAGKLVAVEGNAVAIVPFSADEAEARHFTVEQIARHMLISGEGLSADPEREELVVVPLSADAVMRIAAMVARIVEKERGL